MNFALCGLSGANFALRSLQADFAQFPGPQEHYLPVQGRHHSPGGVHRELHHHHGRRARHGEQNVHRHKFHLEH